MVRISFGMYTTFDDVDRLVDALATIARDEYRGSYVQDPASGMCEASCWSPEAPNFFGPSRPRDELAVRRFANNLS
jgi:hypothetical protein